jgi:hypothetical protein
VDRQVEKWTVSRLASGEIIVDLRPIIGVGLSVREFLY